MIKNLFYSKSRFWSNPQFISFDNELPVFFNNIYVIQIEN